MSMAIWSEVTVTRACVGRPRPVSEATNQSQFLPTCVSGFCFFFLFLFLFFVFCFLYIYFLLDSILFLILSSPPDTMALLISEMV